MSPPSLRGAPLGPAHTVAAVAPSGPFPDDALCAAAGRWEGRGRRVVRHLPARPEGYLAGPDPDRARGLLAALDDPSVGGLHAVRGGYGASRVLEGWGEALVTALQRRPVPVAGFSDVTALHAAWWRAGVRSVHGIMLAAAGRALARPPEGAEGTEGEADDFEALAAVLEGSVPAPWEGLGVADGLGPGGATEGLACGGNLTVLASLAGTPWFPRGPGIVWFLEDVGEAPYRIDRSLTQLRLAGAFADARAVVLGAFTDCPTRADGVAVEAALGRGLGGLGVPVLTGGPFGHGGVHRPWVQGARVRVEGGGVVRFLEGLS